jgi:8-oxo-dGTP diphosphatase
MSETAFLAGYDPGRFPPVAVTVDVALFTLIEGRLAVLLVERGEHPYQGAWALPGGFVRPDETIDEAAARELAEETGVARFSGHLEQLATYGAPDRDPRMRVVSVAHVAIAPRLPPARAGSDAAQAQYWAIDELGLPRRRKNAPELAFDHDEILRDALERVRSKLEYTSLATEFLQTPFTITALRRVYEAVWGHELDPGNFQRKVLGTPGFLEPTDELASPGAGGGRKARLYRPGAATSLHPAVLRPKA